MGGGIKEELGRREGGMNFDHNTLYACMQFTNEQNENCNTFFKKVELLPSSAFLNH